MLHTAAVAHGNDLLVMVSGWHGFIGAFITNRPWWCGSTW